MHIPSYPPELEAHWIDVARTETKTIALRDILHRIEPDIVRMANRFTTERPSEPETTGSPYLKDTRSCAAYSLFFAPQTHARLTHILAELPAFPDTPKPLRVLDLGCGTGAASWALLDHLGARPVALTAWDHSRPALRCLHDLFSAVRRARWPEAILRTTPAPLSEFTTAPEPYDVILIHYVLNELPPEEQRLLLSRAGRALAPGGRLIVCEPLVHAEGDYMRELRAYALKDLGLHLLAPCPHAQDCPLDGPCHDVRTWKISQALQILNNTLRRDLRHLPYALLVLTPEPPVEQEILCARLVGSPTHAKGQTTGPACCPDGEVHRLQLLHRDFDTAGRKKLRHLERGQRLHLRSITPLGDPTLFRAVPATKEP